MPSLAVRAVAVLAWVALAVWLLTPIPGRPWPTPGAWVALAAWAGVAFSVAWLGRPEVRWSRPDRAWTNLVVGGGVMVALAFALRLHDGGVLLGDEASGLPREGVPAAAWYGGDPGMPSWLHHGVILLADVLGPWVLDAVHAASFAVVLAAMTAIVGRGSTARGWSVLLVACVVLAPAGRSVLLYQLSLWRPYALFIPLATVAVACADDPRWRPWAWWAVLLAALDNPLLLVLWGPLLWADRGEPSWRRQAVATAAVVAGLAPGIVRAVVTHGTLVAPSPEQDISWLPVVGGLVVAVALGDLRAPSTRMTLALGAVLGLGVVTGIVPPGPRVLTPWIPATTALAARAVDQRLARHVDDAVVREAAPILVALVSLPYLPSVVESWRTGPALAAWAYGPHLALAAGGAVLLTVGALGHVLQGHTPGRFVTVAAVVLVLPPAFTQGAVYLADVRQTVEVAAAVATLDEVAVVDTAIHRLNKVVLPDARGTRPGRLRVRHGDPVRVRHAAALRPVPTVPADGWVLLDLQPDTLPSDRHCVDVLGSPPRVRSSGPPWLAWCGDAPPPPIARVRW